jgi:transcription initiation factor IIE alpha subunit
MPYLICDRCNGYYELQEGESKADFQSCQCGGNLFYTDELEDYTEHKRQLNH